MLMPTKLSAFQPIIRPIFSGVTPHKLRHHFFGPPRLQLLARGQARSLVPFVTSSFSTRSSRERMGSGSEHNVRAKSLIDDEADLSDWVSGLKSSSFTKTRVYSDSEDDENNGNGGFRGREGAGKRRRESGFEKDSNFESRRGGGGRRSNGGSSGSMFGGRGKGRDSSDFRREGKFGGPSQGRGNDRDSGEFRRDGRFGGPSLGRGNGRGDSVEFRRDGRFGGPSRGRGNGRGDSGGGLSQGRGQGRDSGEFRMNGKFGGTSQEKRENGSGFLSRGSERSREKSSKVGYRNGRDSSDGQSGFAMQRRGKETGKREIFGTDDEDTGEEEEKEKGYMSFKGLIDSNEDEDDDDNEEEVEEEEEDETFEKVRTVAHAPQSSLQASDSHLSESRFDECPISPLSLKGIKDAGYERMTLVQEATLPVILKGKDVLAKAKTGTGKTVAFLLPAIELVAKSSMTGRDQKRPPIFVLVMCPTRELASQAAAEANKLLKYHPSIGVQVVIGGTRLALEQKRMQANPCKILVATPGRLRDHIENTSGFATRLMGVKVLVLDEADHLLDMGFRNAIEKIIAAVPKERQTLLFSATVPPEVRQICHIALKRDHEFINTVQEGSEDTHSQVRQMHLVAPLDKHFPLLYTMLKEHIADDVNYKILVFCTTAMVTRLVADLLGELTLNVREIHSRKPQNYRTRVSDEFRKSKGLILVTSDVSARGVDYPDVTLVIQIGVPSDRQQYIHRLGRTGRKGKEGQGILMLAPWEEFFLSSIKDLPISKATEPLIDPDTRKKVERALSHVEMKNKEAAYQAWLGYYNSNKGVGRDKYKLVQLANEFSRCMGLDNPPAISKLVLGKMGLKNIPGLRSK